ncbi:ABC transporter ATP-binding protein [Piscinibacter sakaiensis]|uniref:Ferric iron ABC transporter, ATP-binding protein n=1 Tax=Piscinibacter sakaiensis TaxID=1547922 RepID=A0A0K8P3C7_PISS1|nr:ABC transporter ATP-binding protein [Piscinibacter sakaiensis]GAP37128.1 ferric iron ABC transporter, ATP-binding protein [Piscinibacter sakaiensis]
MFLEIVEASVHYGRGPRAAGGDPPRPAVDRVSLALARGEIGVLIGPSGCGKTSLLRAVAGLEPLSGGRLAIDGDPLSDAARGLHCPAEARRIGMVFQDYALFPHLDVAANVAFGIRHLPPAQRRERVQEVLALVGLPQVAARAPHQLSGGQQQRVALARALAPQPRLMLLDEPFSSLDAELRERLAQELRGILKASGTTALFVTHDQLEAFAVGDRIGVMHRGRLEQWDAPYALYHRPRSRFVAGFIGDSVFTEARVVRSPGDLPLLRTALGDLAPPPGLPLPAPSPDGRLDVLLRADDVVHDDDAPLKARVERKAFHGASFLYTLRLPGGEQVLAHVPSHHDHQVGDWIGIRAELDHLVAFPPEPGPVPATPPLR